MGTLIDSSILIAAERGAIDLASELETRQSEAFAIAAITASEVLHGVLRLQGVHQARARAHVEGWLRELAVVAFDRPIAETHAVLAVDLAGRGETMGAHELQIAATAVRLGYGVATHDRRSFSRLPDLPVQYW